MRVRRYFSEESYGYAGEFKTKMCFVSLRADRDACGEKSGKYDKRSRRRRS